MKGVKIEFLFIEEYENGLYNKSLILIALYKSNVRADAKMPTTKNIERQMFSVGDQISQKNSTSGFTWDRIPSKTK